MIHESDSSVSPRRRRILGLGALAVVVALALSASIAYVTSGGGPKHQGTISPSPTPLSPANGAPPSLTVPPPSGPSFTVPSSIASDCATDVTNRLNAWIASVPDGSVLVFHPNGCYEIEGSIYVADRHNLFFEGNGAEFLAKTAGTDSKPPANNRGHLRWPQARSQWWIERGSGITLDHVVVHGAANIVPYEGVDWGQNAKSPNRIPYYIGQYGVLFAGTDGAALENSTVTDTFSDLVGVTADDPSNRVDPHPATNVTITNNVLQRSDRDGPSVYDGSNVMIAHNSIGDVWGPIVDLEPVATRWAVANVTVLDNTAGPHAHYFVTAAGASATNSNLLIQGNSVTSGDMTFFVGSKRTSPPIRTNITIMGNRADRANRSAVLIEVRGINGLTISGNTSPTGGTAVSLAFCSGVSITDNSFLGAQQLVRAENGTQVTTEQGNTT